MNAETIITPWMEIFKQLSVYGPLGIMAFIFLRKTVRETNMLFKNLEKTNTDLREALKSIYDKLDRELVAFRESLMNHNQRTLESLAEIENRVKSLDIDNCEEKEELHKLIRELSDYIDETRSVVAEIKYVCPSRYRRQIGDIMVEQGFITSDELAKAIKLQEETHEK